jgi:hypothetical protein
VHRNQPVRDVADQRSGGPGMNGAEVHGESVGEALPLGDQPSVTQRGFCCLIGHSKCQYYDGLAS